jgi:transcriptional regulator with XRE-family HTH domain
MLQNVLKGAMDERNLSAREIASLIGVTHTTILRALRGEKIDLPTLIKIAEWLNIRPSALLDTLGDDAQIEAKIGLLVQAYPELQGVLEKAAVAVENGQADPALIKDIIAYAEYRIQSASGGSNH